MGGFVLNGDDVIAHVLKRVAGGDDDEFDESTIKKLCGIRSPKEYAETIRKESRIPIDMKARVLLDIYKEFKLDTSIKPGDLVVQRPWGCYASPPHGQPAVVLEVLKEPIIDDTKDSGNPRWMQPNHWCIGFVRGGEILTWYVDGRQFERYRGAVA